MASVSFSFLSLVLRVYIVDVLVLVVAFGASSPSCSSAVSLVLSPGYPLDGLPELPICEARLRKVQCGRQPAGLVEQGAEPLRWGDPVSVGQ